MAQRDEIGAVYGARLPLEVATAAGATPDRRGRSALPPVFWTFAAFALLYGICETMNGNWAGLYVTRRLRRDGYRGLVGPYPVLGYGDRREGVVCSH